jgi:hypothetical protein
MASDEFAASHGGCATYAPSQPTGEVRRLGNPRSRKSLLARRRIEIVIYGESHQIASAKLRTKAPRPIELNEADVEGSDRGNLTL